MPEPPSGGPLGAATPLGSAGAAGGGLRAAVPASALQSTPPKLGEAPAKRGICVSIDHYGKPVRMTADSPAEFHETIRGATLSWVNFGVDDLRNEGEVIAGLLGFSNSLVSALLDDRLSAYEDRDSELGFKLPVVKVSGLDVEVVPLLVLAREGIVLTLHDREKVHRMTKLARYADAFMRKINRESPWNDKLTLVLARIINENNDRNFDGLRSIEEQGDRIAKLLVDRQQPTDLGIEIYQMKHGLIQYLDTLWASLDVVQSLRHGDAECVSDDDQVLARFSVLSSELTHQVQLTEHMSEVLASGMEVLQSIYNNQLQQLNNRLAMAFTWLTILGTVILVPNTLATMFGPITSYEGAAFYRMVGLHVGLTLVATLFSWAYVRRVLPRKPIGHYHT